MLPITITECIIRCGSPWILLLRFLAPPSGAEIKAETSSFFHIIASRGLFTEYLNITLYDRNATNLFLFFLPRSYSYISHRNPSHILPVKKYLFCRNVSHISVQTLLTTILFTAHIIVSPFLSCVLFVSSLLVDHRLQKGNCYCLILKILPPDTFSFESIFVPRKRQTVYFV